MIESGCRGHSRSGLASPAIFGDFLLQESHPPEAYPRNETRITSPLARALDIRASAPACNDTKTNGLRKNRIKAQLGGFDSDDASAMVGTVPVVGGPIWGSGPTERGFSCLLALIEAFFLPRAPLVSLRGRRGAYPVPEG